MSERIYYTVRRKTGEGHNSRLMTLEEAEKDFESAKTEEGVYYAAVCKSVGYGTAQVVHEWDSSNGKERWQYNKAHAAQYDEVETDLNIVYYLSRGQRVAFFRSCDELTYTDAYVEIMRSGDAAADKRRANALMDARVMEKRQQEGLE